MLINRIKNDSQNFNTSSAEVVAAIAPKAGWHIVTVWAAYAARVAGCCNIDIRKTLFFLRGFASR
jgi:hypothetical protein